MGLRDWRDVPHLCALALGVAGLDDPGAAGDFGRAVHRGAAGLRTAGRFRRALDVHQSGSGPVGFCDFTEFCS